MRFGLVLAFAHMLECSKAQRGREIGLARPCGVDIANEACKRDALFGCHLPQDFHEWLFNGVGRAVAAERYRALLDRSHLPSALVGSL